MGASKAVLAQQGQPVMLGTFAEQYSCFSGQIQTRQAFGNGCFKAAFRPAKTAGVVSAMMAKSLGAPNQEIALQFRGADASTLYIMSWVNGQVAATHSVALGFDASLSDHVYGIAWGPQSTDITVDGRAVHTLANYQAPPAGSQL